MKHRFIKAGVCAFLAASFLTGCSETGAKADVDLNSMKIEQIIEKAKEDGEINSVGMPDTWANWVETWDEIEAEYGIRHSDTDMSSAEELAIFKMARKLKDKMGEEIIKQHIISHSESVSDLLELAIMLKEVGLIDRHSARVQIVPLFETIEDLDILINESSKISSSSYNRLFVVYFCFSV